MTKSGVMQKDLHVNMSIICLFSECYLFVKLTLEIRPLTFLPQLTFFKTVVEVIISKDTIYTYNP